MAENHDFMSAYYLCYNLKMFHKKWIKKKTHFITRLPKSTEVLDLAQTITVIEFLMTAHNYEILFGSNGFSKIEQFRLNRVLHCLCYMIKNQNYAFSNLFIFHPNNVPYSRYELFYSCNDCPKIILFIKTNLQL